MQNIDKVWQHIMSDYGLGNTHATLDQNPWNNSRSLTVIFPVTAIPTDTRIEDWVPRLFNPITEAIMNSPAVLYKINHLEEELKKAKDIKDQLDRIEHELTTCFVEEKEE